MSNIISWLIIGIISGLAGYIIFLMYRDEWQEVKEVINPKWLK